jgi:S1-C subfamily serine protease
MKRIAVVLISAAFVALSPEVICSFTIFREYLQQGGRQPDRTASTANYTHRPAPNGEPEPNEAINLPSWAPLVKRVLPVVINVSVTGEITPAAAVPPVYTRCKDCRIAATTNRLR